MVVSGSSNSLKSGVIGLNSVFGRTGASQTFVVSIHSPPLPALTQVLRTPDRLSTLLQPGF